MTVGGPCKRVRGVERGAGRPMAPLAALLAVLLPLVLLVACTTPAAPPPAPPPPTPAPQPSQIVVAVDDLGAGFNPHLLAHQSPVTTALAGLVLRWVREDFESDGGLSPRSGVAIWILYFLHADAVGAAAFADFAKLDLPRSLAVGGGLLVGAAGLAIFVAASGTLARRGDMAGLHARRLLFVRAFREPIRRGHLVIGCGVDVRQRQQPFADADERGPRVAELHPFGVGVATSLG